MASPPTVYTNQYGRSYRLVVYDCIDPAERCTVSSHTRLAGNEERHHFRSLKYNVLRKFSYTFTYSYFGILIRNSSLRERMLAEHYIKNLLDPCTKNIQN